jgi:hypothetical protein
MTVLADLADLADLAILADFKMWAEKFVIHN